MKKLQWLGRLALLTVVLAVVGVFYDIQQDRVEARLDAVEAELSELRQVRAGGDTAAAVDRAVALVALADQAVREARAAVDRQNEELKDEGESP